MSDRNNGTVRSVGPDEEDDTRADVDPADPSELTAALLPRGRRSVAPATKSDGEVPAQAKLPTPFTGGSAITPTNSRNPVRTLSGTRELESRGSIMGEISSPAEALRSEEVERTRAFLRMAIITVIAALVAGAVAGGDRTAKLVLLGGCLLNAVAAGGMLWRTRDDRRAYTSRSALVVAILIAVGANASLVYWGAVSPVTGLLVYGIYFFALGGHRGVTIALYVLCAGLHAGLMLLIVTKTIPDWGLVQLTAIDPLDQFMLAGVVQFLYLISYLTGRTTRRTTLDAVGQLERAVRTVAQREAMLLEARQELDRALKVGGPGRYSEQIIGSFRLGNLIGRGGMGEVYEGVSVHDGSSAAVKLLHPSTLADPRQVSRFVRETEVAARLDCPNVVSVLEVGTTSGEVPFLAMERLAGHDLAHLLRRRRTLDHSAATDLVRGLALGLEAARTAGIVHRDLKPHNVFWAEQTGAGGGRLWKILDFGVSKLASSHGTLTRGQVVGTPAYMAPEQARGEDVDHRADVYALSAIIYRVLTGHPAFSGKDIPSTLYDVVYKMPTQPSVLASLPSDIDRVLALGLAKVANERIATAGELAELFTLAIGPGLPQAVRRRADELTERWTWGTRR